MSVWGRRAGANQLALELSVHSLPLSQEILPALLARHELAEATP
jgi:hypothetical protein